MVSFCAIAGTLPCYRFGKSCCFGSFILLTCLSHTFILDRTSQCVFIITVQDIPFVDNVMFHYKLAVVDIFIAFVIPTIDYYHT